MMRTVKVIAYFDFEMEDGHDIRSEDLVSLLEEKKTSIKKGQIEIDDNGDNEVFDVAQETIDFLNTKFSQFIE